MKKEKFSKLLVFLTAFILIILSVQIVSANSHTVDFIKDFIQQTKEAIEQIFEPIFSALLGVDNTDEFLFAKVLALFLIYAIVSMSLRKSDIFSGQRSIVIIISGIVSILAIRFIKEDSFFKGLLLPYGALGGAILIFLPLMIYFIFVHTSVPGTFGRRAAWVAYGIVFGTLWGMRQADIGNANQVYFGGMIFVIIVFLFDPAIHRYFNTLGLERSTGRLRTRELRIARTELADLEEARRRGIITDAEYRNERSAIKERIRSLS